MADENIIEIIVQGAQQSVRQIQSVAQAQTELVTVQASAGVRQRQVYDSVAAAAEEAARREEVALQKRAETLKSLEEQSTKTIVTEAAKQADARRQAAIAANAQVAATRSQLAGGAPLGGLQQRVQQQPPTAPVDIRATVAAAQQARAALLAQQAAAQTLQGRLQALGATAAGLAGQLKQLVVGHNAAAQAATTQANATQQAGTRGITYLSVLSAIHAASFLATNQTFSMVGSFVTLGAAFGKVGIAAAGVGLALGAVLGIIGTLNAAIQHIQEVAVQGAEGFVTLAAGIAAGAVAAGTAATKLASGIETQVASVRAFGGATATQLARVSEQAIEFSDRFGVAAADVAQATSLFARAGGTVQEAIDGATEAIIRLQVASQGELTAAQSAIALSAAMRQFNLTGKDAVKVADSLTAAAQSSALSFTGVQQAFIQAAPGAAALGITLDDLTASIALLGDQLIKGTTTGTAFKQFIIDVVNPTNKAETELAKYGISLRDANGNALPFVDALIQLNKGLGDNAVESGLVSKEQRATALAIAFGSRAFLAANILTREGTDALELYREKIAQVSTSNIVDVLLLPLEKQLERVSVAAQNTGATFGGPLLGPIRQAATAAIEFLKGIRPAAELAGQAIGVVLTGQGFGALQVAIDKVVGHNALASFFIELVNSARNVRDVIVSQIIPAIESFFQQLAGSGALESAVSGFDNLNQTIQNIGARIAGTITALGTLAAEFVKGEGAGGRLRTTIEGVASAILTHLAASLTTTLVVLRAAIVAMPAFARISLLAAEALLTLAGAANEFLLKTTDIAQMATKAILAKQIADQVQYIQALRDAGKATAAEEDKLNSLRAALERVDPASESWKKEIAASSDEAKRLTATVQSSLASLDNLAAQFSQTSEAANPIVTVFDDLAGSVTTALDNVIAVTEQKQRELERSAQGTKPGAVGALSDTELKKAGARIEEAGRDVNRRLANLGEDAATRVRENIARALERLDDIKQNALDRVDEINRQAQDRITEGRRTSDERRQDRDQIDAAKQLQEDKFTIFQRGLDKQEVAEQRSLDDRQRLRSQDTDDFLRELDQQVQDVEKTEQRKLDLVQRGFDLAQRAREIAFDRAQGVEATAFSRQQEAAAEARRFSLDLAKAKTPEDKAKLIQQRKEATADTQFKQGQEDALTKFRQKQEDAKRKFSDAAEVQAIGFRQGLEDRLTAFRRGNELAVIKKRRELETAEIGTRREEENETTRRRLANEDKVTARRREDVLAIQHLQDAIEDKRRGEEEVRILGNAFNEAQKVIAAAEKQAGEVIDKLFLDLNQQADDVDKQLRNIVDTLVDLGDQVPPELLGAFLAQLTEAQGKVQAIKSDLSARQGAAQLQVSQQKAVNQAELELKLAQLLPQAAGAAMPRATGTPAPVLQLQTLQVANVQLPPGFSASVAGAVRLGIQQAVEQGLLPRSLDVDLTQVVNPLDAIRRFIGR